MTAHHSLFCLSCGLDKRDDEDPPGWCRWCREVTDSGTIRPPSRDARDIPSRSEEDHD